MNELEILQEEIFKTMHVIEEKLDKFEKDWWRKRRFDEIEEYIKAKAQHDILCNITEEINRLRNLKSEDEGK